MKFQSTPRPALLLLALVLLAGAPLAQAKPSVMDGPRTFKVHVENVSTTSTLKLSDGTTAPAPTSPVFFAVFSGLCPLFVAGKPDAGQGLEGLAEDGNPSALVTSFSGMKDHGLVGAVAVPNGDTNAGPLLPGKSFDLTVTAEPGQRLMLAMMFGQSNDLFYAPEATGITLFDGKGRPVAGDITKQLLLWDAGTEVNQEPGKGPDQGPRQKGPNTGADEKGTVRLVKDGFKYPAVTSVLKVTVTPEAMPRS